MVKCYSATRASKATDDSLVHIIRPRFDITWSLRSDEDCPTKVSATRSVALAVFVSEASVYQLNHLG